MAMQMEVYIGLLVFAGYVLFDTQVIVERASAGDFDSVKHAMDLFVDFFSIVVRLMVILMNKEQQRKEREERERRRKRN